ncbi:glycosyltransferase [Alkalibacterium putridalgicola]|uniref:glycosyltransferase n=1 Tax=Alkalibacterium putridalgicola TaxID=426703 RepID=UPI0034CD2522
MDKKINIYYYLSGFGSGGIEKYSVNLYKKINKDTISLDFYTWEDKKEFFDKELTALGTKKNPYKKDSGNLTGLKRKYKIAKNIYASFKRKKYDVAYFNLTNPIEVLKLPLLCRLLGIKNIIIHSHSSGANNMSRVQKYQYKIGKIMISFIAAEYFACSEPAAGWMYSSRILNRQKHVIIKNGIDMENYLFNPIVREKTRKELNMTNALVIGHVGRLSKTKNHSFLIDIFNQVLKKKTNAKLVLFGTGTLESELKEKVAQMNLTDSVLFYGETNRIPEMLQAIDIFILPSLFEGLPMVGVEAQASGTRSFFSNTISPEILLTEVSSMVSLESSPEEWADKIINSDLAKKRTGKVLSDAGYNVSHTAAMVEKIVMKYSIQ